MQDIGNKIKQFWERDKVLIVAGAVMLLGPSLIRGRGRPSNIMRLIEIVGLGVLGYTVYKNRDLIGL